MKKIYLNQGKYALVDDEDFEKVNAFQWHFNNGYARRDFIHVKLYMHRFILNPKKGEIVDHKNGNPLDNRKENLRICNQSLNLANQRLSIKNTSGYKGVCWHKTLKYWVAQIKVNQKCHAKYFKNKEDAARGYNEMAFKYFGEFSLQNKV